MSAREEVRKRINLLKEEDGFIDEENVIETAKDPNDILHKYFIWDDAKAGHEYRKVQARHLLSWISYTETTTKADLDCSALVSVFRVKKRAGYISINDAKKNEEFVNSVFNEELQRAKGALKRALAISEALGLRERLEHALGLILELEKLVA